MNTRKCPVCNTIQNIKDQITCSICGNDVSNMVAAPSIIKNIKEARLFELADEVMEYIDESIV